MMRLVRFPYPLVTGLAATLALGLPLAAQAYVGPGAGLSLLSALWGIIAAIGVALLFVIMWPIRRMRRRRRARQIADGTPDAAASMVRSDTTRDTAKSSDVSRH